MVIVKFFSILLIGSFFFQSNAVRPAAVHGFKDSIPEKMDTLWLIKGKWLTTKQRDSIIAECAEYTLRSHPEWFEKKKKSKRKH